MSNSDGLLISDKHLRQLSALYTVADMLNSRFGQRRILQDVLDTMESQLGLLRGTIMLLSPDGSRLHVEAAHNFSSSDLKKTTVSYERGEGITGRVLQTGKPAVVPRIADEPEFRDRIHRRNKQKSQNVSFICVPIAFGNEAVGTLAADVLHEGILSPEEGQQLLSIISSMIAHDVKLRREARLEQQALEEENLRLRSEIEEQYRPENITGNSRAMRQVYQRIDQVAKSDTTVLIRGESGTGKELVASAVHYQSSRADKPFIKVNCAALSENLLESELFGHERGAFTGAVQTRVGRIEEAQGGTLFLDEIGEFSLSIQVKILRVLQEKEYQRVGSNTTVNADVRIIAATNRDLEAAVEEGSFRQDLYYRINVFPIYLPPLRERKDDIMILADYFVEKYSKKIGKNVRRIGTPAINMMQAYHWPGNVRELENCIEHAVLLSQDGVIHGYDLPPTLQIPTAAESQSLGKLKDRVNLLERDMIIEGLKLNKGSVRLAAKELGITPRMIRYKIKNLNIDYQKYFKRRRHNPEE